MNKKEALIFAFESFFNRTINKSNVFSISKIDHFRQIKRLNKNLEISSLRYLFDKYKFDYVIDVGANIGQYYDFIRKKIEFKGPIISIEPSPDDYTILKANCKNDNNLICFNVACSDAAGKAFLNVYKSSTLNSLYESSEYLKGRINQTTSKVEVELTTLETLLDKLNISSKSNIFLKVDTQGHDRYVIAGLGKYISNIVSLQVELSLIPLYQGVAKYDNDINYLNSLGFNLFSSTPVLRDKHDDSIIELNGFFVKSIIGN